MQIALHNDVCVCVRGVATILSTLNVLATAVSIRWPRKILQEYDATALMIPPPEKPSTYDERVNTYINEKSL